MKRSSDDFRTAAPLCLLLGAGLAAASLPQDWHRLETNEYNLGSFTERGWDVQPLGLLLLLASTVVVGATLVSLALRLAPRRWALWLGLAGAAGARLWMLLADFYPSHQEDRASRQGFGYGMLEASIVLFVLALWADRGNHGVPVPTPSELPHSKSPSS